MVFAALGSAIVRAGWFGRTGGRVAVGLPLGLTVAVVAGLVAAGAGSEAGAWIVFVLTIPFVVFVVPFGVGVALVRRARANLD